MTQSADIYSYISYLFSGESVITHISGKLKILGIRP